jgi:release factor glutamine methyltransferase
VTPPAADADTSAATTTGSDARNVGQWLAHARDRGLDRVDAHALLGHHLQRDRGWLIAHDGDPVPMDIAQRFAVDCERRALGEPLAYITGWREFHGLRLRVGPSVLVPRPDTETLVDWALELMPAAGAPAVVDLGTGSGAIALALAQRCPDAQIVATDISGDALAWAAANAERLALQLAFARGAWWEAVGDRRFHLAVSNPPYIAAADPHLADLRHEPLQALSPGGDGLDAVRQIVAMAPRHLHQRGWLLLEHGWDQAADVQALLRAAGFEEIATRTDLAGLPRCTSGRWCAAGSR